MAGFLDTLAVKEIDGDDQRWRLLEPCLYHLKVPDGDEWVDVPIGFVTDFGSIPRLLWGVPGLSPFGKYRRAYVVHDKLFRAPVVRSALSARAISFSETNDILREAMQVLGANWWLRQFVWTGVSTGGRLSWNRYRHADQETA
jgi:hypothetical protein